MKDKKFWNVRIHILVLLSLCLVLTLLLWSGNKIVFFAALAVVLIYGVLLLLGLRNMGRQINTLLSAEAQRLSGSDREALQNFPLPTIVVTGRREIVWYNDLFRERVLDGRDTLGTSLDTITTAKLPDFCRTEGLQITYRGRIHRVTGMHVKEGETGLYNLYFTDITQLTRDAELYHMTRPSVMLVMLDNYSDMMQQSRESEKSRIIGAIDSSLEDFIGRMTTSFIKRYEGDKFLMVVEERHLEKIIEGRFAILDEVRRIETNGSTPVTLSIGVGRGEETLAQSEASARQALDMALGRGGDQAAIKNQSQYEFYGGVSKGVEKRTKVKSRIVANALSELIETADHVLVMGHKFGDLDCVGAAVGMATAVRSLGKQAEVVIDREKNLANILIDMVTRDGNNNLFIDPDEAKFGITPETLLIICDTHTQNLLESAEVYERCKTVVVIDHHRKMVNHIDNAVIFYHEPYASSASEMVTELIQYMGDHCRISSVAAQALLSGIMLDTRNFVLKTGVRTFEAAAYLRRIGADTIVVRKLFSSSLDSYQRKTRIVNAAQIYKTCAVAESDFSSEDMRVVAPQAADELLGIDGVDGSFVLYDAGGTINISARSMGAINVQLIMEKMGGGGHHTMAGAQIRNVEMEKAKQMLLESIDQYFKEKG
ncbi:MAG: DHH family phosphoesterase [Oscillospiraceae bacterium]|nr:DHH family phosphoesterase [Oscillospiraceae bacterium]